MNDPNSPNEPDVVELLHAQRMADAISRKLHQPGAPTEADSARVLAEILRERMSKNPELAEKQRRLLAALMKSRG